MSLLWPIALLGLITVPLILILHLLRNRRDQIDIPSLRFWRGLERKRHGALPRQIPLSWMLLLQLLIAAALTLGLARPALSFLLSQPRHTVFILDMTTSMIAEDVASGVDGHIRRFDAARQMIRSELETMREQDSFSLISLDPRPQILLRGGGEKKVQALVALDNLVPGASGLNLSTALTLANGVIDDPNREHRIVVLTDGNYPSPDSLPPVLAPVTWQIIPGQATSNQALLNVSASILPDGRHRLFGRVVNYGPQAVNRTLRLSTGAGLFDEITVQLEPQAETTQVWTLPGQAEIATVELVEADALALDNRAELLLTNPTSHRVLLISNTPEVLSRALEVQPGVELQVDTPEMSQHDPAEFDLVIFDGLPAALTAWPVANVLIVNPPLGHPLLPAQGFERNLRPDPDSASALLAGIDLSGVYFGRAPQLDLPEWSQVDLRAVSPSGNEDAATPLLFHGSDGDSRLVVWAFDLADSNLPARLALPILTANTLSTLLSPSPPAVVPVGEPVSIDDNYTVEIPGGRQLTPTQLTGEAGLTFAHTKQPGLYRIYNQQAEPVAGFAVHAGSALESNLTEPLQPELLDITDVPAQTALAPQIEIEDIWPWLAGLALVVVVAEGWLAWRR